MRTNSKEQLCIERLYKKMANTKPPRKIVYVCRNYSELVKTKLIQMVKLFATIDCEVCCVVMNEKQQQTKKENYYE